MKPSTLRLLTVFCILSAIQDVVVSIPINGTQDGVISRSDKEVCMKELGCFSITSDFKHILYRPINVLPNDREVINTRFLLYTRQNPKEPDELFTYSKESIIESHLDPSKPIKFIVHGFMDSELFGPWMARMKDEFLLHGDYNIVIIDWSGGNKPPYYQATSNTRVVGAETALIIKALKKHTGILPEDCHIIGHSLGSHVAGYAGERLKKLGRITGCDPAEPYFQNMPPSVRLDPTDADYVDVIHSDAKSILLLGFGMSQPVGHADFYPNNGRNQPGCKKDKYTKLVLEGLNEGLRRFVSCNHQRSLDFMHYTINYRKVVPVGYECTSWETFLRGKCVECGKDLSKCAIMGIRADEYKAHRNSSVQHSFYLKTGPAPPYWLYHYQVMIKLFKPRVKYEDQKGTFELNLHGSKEDYLTELENDDLHLYHGSRYQFLVTTDKELGDIKSVTLQWFSSSKNPLKLIFKPKLYVQYIVVVPMNHVENSPRDMSGKIFCSNPDSPILPKVISAFHKDDKCQI